MVILVLGRLISLIYYFGSLLNTELVDPFIESVSACVFDSADPNPIALTCVLLLGSSFLSLLESTPIFTVNPPPPSACHQTFITFKGSFSYG